jgi:hypothetical protein
LQERYGKVTESCRKISGTWKQYYRREFSGFFSMISGRILLGSTGSHRNSPEKILKIPDRDTASNFLVFPVVSWQFCCRRSFTWGWNSTTTYWTAWGINDFTGCDN